MSPRSDDEIDVLLSRGKLGGSQQRRILDRALSAARPGLWARWRGRFAWGGGGLALATGVAAVVLAVRTPQETAAFRVKGSGDAPLITVSCLGATVAACPSGSKLAFAVEGGHDSGGFLTAYAAPTSSGERIWLLTNEPVSAAPGDASPRVIRKAALVGDRQPPGSYRVFAIFSRGLVTRAEIARVAPADTLARAEIELVVAP